MKWHETSFWFQSIFTYKVDRNSHKSSKFQLKEKNTSEPPGNLLNRIAVLHQMTINTQFSSVFVCTAVPISSIPVHCFCMLFPFYEMFVCFFIRVSIFFSFCVVNIKLSNKQTLNIFFRRANDLDNFSNSNKLCGSKKLVDNYNFQVIQGKCMSNNRLASVEKEINHFISCKVIWMPSGNCA